MGAESLDWRSSTPEEAETLLKENEKEHKFDALYIGLPHKWELLGEQVSIDELDVHNAAMVTKLVQRLRTKLSDSSLLTILIHVSALLLQDLDRRSLRSVHYEDDYEDEFAAALLSNDRSVDDPILRLVAAVARDVGLPIEEMPALKKGIDGFNGAFHFPSDELLALAATIKRYGNSLKGFGLGILSMSESLRPVKMPTSSFQQLCSTISTHPCLRTLMFSKVDLGYDIKLTDAICEIFISAATLCSLILNRSGKPSRQCFEALSKAPLEELRFFDTQVNKGLDCLLRGTNRLRTLTLKDTGLDEKGVGFIGQAAASSKLMSLQELDVTQFIGSGADLSNMKVFFEALQGGQLLQLRSLTLIFNKSATEDMKFLAAALRSPYCSLHRLHIYIVESSDQSNAYTSLGEALKDPHCKLTDLNVTLGQKNTEFPQVFFDAIKKSQTLQKLGLRDTMMPDEQAKFGRWLRDSNLIELECGPFQHDDLFQGLLASKVRRLSIYPRRTELAKLCDLLLENPACSLQSLKLYYEMDIRDQTQVLEALDRNYQSRLEDLYVPWESEALEKKCSDLLKRNSLFRAVSIPDKDPYVAKLFLCGPSGAGKTTIKKNITRQMNLPLPGWVQRHPSTSGMEMDPLVFGNTGKKLLICDMAGQFEFHAFHHSFLRGIDKSLFLIVLKVDNTYNRAKLTTELVYWLRFIASHKTSSSKGKPKVFVALNFFHGMTTSAAHSLAKEQVQIYQEVLEMNEDDGILEVKATDPRSLQDLRDLLGKSLDTLLSQQHKVPGLCEAAKDVCLELKKKKKKMMKALWSRSRRNKQIVEVKDLGGKLLAQHHKDMRTKFSDADKDNFIRFIFLFLHDMGEVVYFEMGESISKYAILEVNWFIHDVISLFIDPQKIKSSWNSQEQTEQALRKIADILSTQCGGEQSKVEFVFQCLYEMGVVIPMGNWTGTWNPIPEKVIVPALSGMNRAYPPHGRTAEEHRHWGRRLECEDVKFKLFPSGIFAMVQAKVHLHCKNPSFDVGSGWVTFKENRIGVYLRIGGDTDAWTDRQWVEIMVLAPRDGNLNGAEELMNKMRNCVMEVCFGELEIGEEKVLKTGYVKQRMHQPHGTQIQGNQQLNSLEVAAPLSEILKEAEEQGLTYSHTWNRSEDDKLSDLLLPSEETKIARKKTMKIIRVCEDYQKTVKEVYGTPELKDPIPEIPKGFEHGDFEKLAGYMRDIARGHREQLDRIEATLDEIKVRMERMGKEVLAHSSKMLHLINVTCPRSPYLVNADNNKFMKYVQIQKRVKISYLCEFGDANHPVHNAQGVEVKLPIEWLKEWGSVLIPALVILFIGLKVGATVLNIPIICSMVDAVVDPSQSSILDFIKSNMAMEALDVEAWKAMKPTKKDIEDVFSAVCKQAGAGTDREIKRMMHKSFGLQWDTVAGAWLCETHYLE